MFKIWDPSNFRRTVAALSLILAPVLFSVAEVLYQLLPAGGDDPVAQLASNGQQRGIWLCATFAGLMGAVLFIPAIFGLMQVIRTRGVVLAHVGGGVAILGNALAGLVLAGFQLVLYDLASPANDHRAIGAAVQHGMHDPALAVIPFGHNLFAIGILLLGIAAWRARLAGRVAGILVVAAVVVDVVVGTVLGDSIAVGIVSDALLVVGLGAIGVQLLGAPDSAWESGIAPTPQAQPTVAARS